MGQGVGVDGGILNLWKNMRKARDGSGGRAQSCGRGRFIWNGFMEVVMVGGGGAVGRVGGRWGQGGVGGGEGCCGIGRVGRWVSGSAVERAGRVGGGGGGGEWASGWASEWASGGWVREVCGW